MVAIPRFACRLLTRKFHTLTFQLFPVPESYIALDRYSTVLLHHLKLTLRLDHHSPMYLSTLAVLPLANRRSVTLHPCLLHHHIKSPSSMYHRSYPSAVESCGGATSTMSHCAPVETVADYLWPRSSATSSIVASNIDRAPEAASLRTPLLCFVRYWAFARDDGLLLRLCRGLGSRRCFSRCAGHSLPVWRSGCRAG